MPRLTPQVGRLWKVALLAGAVAAVVWSAPRLRTLSFIADASGFSGWPKRIAEWQAKPFDERLLAIPTRSGSIRGRLYTPIADVRRAVVLASGIHPDGIDEPRLVKLARALAKTGIAVFTPDLPDLSRFEITPRTIDLIEETSLWVAEQRHLAPDLKVGMMGISFSGGLALVAAGRPALRDHVAFVFALGGHGDLPRVLRYLCTGKEPDGHYRAPHDYSLAVVLIGVARAAVPPDQVEPLRAAIRKFLDASALETIKSSGAVAAFEEARKLESALPNPARTLMHLVNTRDVAALGPRLRPMVDRAGTDPSLSPERSAPPAAPVFLLHGADDNVIPSIESRLLASHLTRTTEVRLLISNLITHAETDRPWKPGEVWSLVSFWTDLRSR